MQTRTLFEIILLHQCWRARFWYPLVPNHSCCTFVRLCTENECRWGAWD